MAKNVLVIPLMILYGLGIVACSSATKVATNPDLETFPSQDLGQIRFEAKSPDEPFELHFKNDSSGVRALFTGVDGKVEAKLPAGTYSLQGVRIVEQKEQKSTTAPLQWTIEKGKTTDAGIIFTSCSDWNDDSDTTKQFREIVQEKREWTHVYPYEECLVFWKSPGAEVPALDLSADAAEKIAVPTEVSLASDKDCSGATQLVQQYVDKDLNGEFLKSSAWLKSNSNDGVGQFDSITVVQSVKVLGCKKSANGFKVQVQYESLGTAKTGEKISAEELEGRRFKTKTTTLQVLNTAKGLRLDSEILPVPHVGISAAIRWLNK